MCVPPRWKASGDVCAFYSAVHVHQCTTLYSSLHSSSFKQASRVVTLSQSTALLTPSGVHNYILTLSGVVRMKKRLEDWRFDFASLRVGRLNEGLHCRAPPGSRSVNLSFSAAAGTSKPRLPPVRGFWKWTPVSWHLEDSYGEWEMGCGARWAHLSCSQPVNTGHGEVHTLLPSVLSPTLQTNAFIYKGLG